MRITRTIRQITTHHINTLHVYCRLVDMGIEKKNARYICESLEKLGFHKLLYNSSEIRLPWWMPRIKYFVGSLIVSATIAVMYFLDRFVIHLPEYVALIW